MPNIKILQPKNCDFNKIQHNFTQTAEQIIDIATYPNGFVLKTITTADEVKIETSQPLIKIDDTTYPINLWCRNGNCFICMGDFRFFCFDQNLLFTILSWISTFCFSSKMIEIRAMRWHLITYFLLICFCVMIFKNTIIFDFSIEYSANVKTYSETFSVNPKAHSDLVQTRASTKDAELKIISYTLQSLVERLL